MSRPRCSFQGSQIAPSDEVGGFFGVLEMMESLSGIVGPTIGGLVAAHGEKRGFNHAPLAVVLAT